ncbi:D-2-hydroxyacid dehydrogenase family protein [Telmatospirillum siberiense]|uniref:3-phosphoglycerate dehydrogenase n=1 Tax=Telmatospirillum siberiense TaxID=382514 RepID=A0A2N3PQ63_9PROT|nr:D-2-hydroxyacid dehydrogenase family protein [Telmatospirillum siberiense]PKU22539.1 3-phosphoglycerate dehydrogenase [Telmatospirillum siberiense]
MRIVIPDDYQHAVAGLSCLKLLRGHRVSILGDLARETDSPRCLAEAEALVLIRERTKVDEAFLKGTPRLRCISQTGKIAGHVDLAACTAAGVAVLEGVGSPIAPAELTWALIMAARRQLLTAARDLRQGLWQTTLGECLHGQVLGIWSYGKIGQMIARYGKAFGMDVAVWGSEASRERAAADGFRLFPSRQALFEGSDVLSLHLRLAAGTAGLIGADDLARMKSSALLVNTSRSGLIAPGALESALAAGRPGYAAVDVFDEEPVYDPHHPLLLMPNVLCTPHIGYVERNSYELYFSKAFENILAFDRGQPANVANPGVLNAG